MIARYALLTLCAAALVVGCVQYDNPHELGSESAASTTVPKPDGEAVGEPDWHDDEDTRGSGWFSRAPDATSTGYWDGFYICTIPERPSAVSCGQSSVISRGETLTVSGSVAIPFGEGMPTVTIGVSGSVTTSQRYEVTSGDCETCWPEICFDASVRRWSRPAWRECVSAGVGAPGQCIDHPARTWYETELSDPRITKGECRDDHLLCAQENPECLPDAGPGDGGTSDGGADDEEDDEGDDGNSSSDVQNDIDDEESIPSPPIHSMSVGLDSGASWDSLDEVALCGLVNERDAVQAEQGVVFTSFVASSASGGSQELSATDRYGCDAPADPTPDSGTDEDAGDAGAPDAGT